MGFLLGRLSMPGVATVSIFVVLKPVPSELIGQIEEIIKCIPRGGKVRGAKSGANIVITTNQS